MANRITQYRPNYFEGLPVQTCEFETAAELLAIPFVRAFADDKGLSFLKYSLLDDWLVAEYD